MKPFRPLPQACRTAWQTWKTLLLTRGLPVPPQLAGGRPDHRTSRRFRRSKVSRGRDCSVSDFAPNPSEDGIGHPLRGWPPLARPLGKQKQSNQNQYPENVVREFEIGNGRTDFSEGIAQWARGNGRRPQNIAELTDQPFSHTLLVPCNTRPEAPKAPLLFLQRKLCPPFLHVLLCGREPTPPVPNSSFVYPAP